MTFDTSKQVYTADATGWQRGLYDDIRATFRAPVVNWIFRTLTANDPHLMRYLWAQLKPLFETQAFGEACVDYRTAVVGPFETALPHYRATDLGLPPWSWAELRGQLRTYDTVVPRLALFFEVLYRSLHDEAVGTEPRLDFAGTAPLPRWLDGDRGRPPTMAAFEGDTAAAETVASVQAFHGFDEGLPSVYRSLVQWPDAFATMWADLEPLVESGTFDSACTAGRDVVVDFVESTPYIPAVGPEALSNAGFEEGTVAALTALFDDFARGPVETVLPAVPLFAATVDAGFKRP